MTENVGKAIIAFKQFPRESNSELRMFRVSRSSYMTYRSSRSLLWLITTSYLLSQFQISGRKSETLSRGFELSVEDVDIRPRV